MLLNPASHLDYSMPDVWSRLAAMFDTVEARLATYCGRVDCAPGWNWRPRLRDYDIWFAVKGRGEMCIGGTVWPIRAGTLFLLRPGDTGWTEQDLADRLTVVFIHLDFYRPGQPSPIDMDGAWLPSRHVQFGDAAQIDRLLTRAVRLLTTRQRLDAVEARWVVQQALLEIYRQDALNHGVTSARLDPRVERVITTLNTRPDMRLTLDEASEIAGLAPPYFSRLFSREAGVSYRAYTLRVRLEQARYLLQETDMSVGQVAHALGYDELFLFSRQFKLYHGYPPTRLRKSAPP